MGAPDPLDGQAALSILQHLPLAMTVVDVDGRLRFVNDSAAKLFGASPEELIGGSAVELTVAAADTTAIVELLANVSAGHPWLGRFPLTGPDGRRIDAWFASTRLDGELVSIGGDAAEMEGALGIDNVESLAARERADAEEANRLLTTLLDAVPVAMAFFDRDGRFIRVNRALAALNGRDPHEYVGASITDVAEVDGDAFGGLVDAVFESGTPLTDRVVSAALVSRPDDMRHWIVSLFPVMLRGAIAWVGATAIDVTEWRRNEDERSRLLDAEKTARQAAEEAAQRLARLQVVTARLAEATTVERVAEIIVAHGAEGLDATMAALMVATPDGSELETYAAAGFDPEAVRTFARVSIDDDLPVTEALRTRELVLLGTKEDRDARWPHLAAVPTLSHSSGAVPLVLEGRNVGAITLGWPNHREFSQADRDFMMALGRQSVLALERVRLYEAERSARALAEQATERMGFLAEASRVLGASLDYNDTLPRLAQLAVREIAHACTIHLVADGEFRVTGAAHRDPERLDALLTAASTVGSSPRFLGRIIATASASVIDEMSDEVIDEIAQSPEHAKAIAAIGLGSVVSVPLVASGRVLGVFSLGLAAGGRRYGEADLPFVHDIAARVAVALENSLTHEARTEVARTLQQSLLPPVAPKIPGLDLATRYHSAGEVEVGGDFFDVFPSGDGRWGVVMGDVCGRGVAAASLTALARYTVRAGAIDEGDPAQVLHLLNRAILDTDTGERFCTITHAVVEPVDIGARVTLACGGHPLPLLLRANGSVEEVGVPGTAIGLFEEIDISEVELELRQGDAIAFFTDGFTEARAPDGRFAPDLLEAALGGAAGGTADQLAEAIDRAVLAFEGGRPRDDMALLILRVPTEQSGR